MTRRISPVAVFSSRATVRSRLRACNSAKQPDVLDRNRCLVREGLHQGDLRVAERLDLEPVDHNDAQQLGALEYGDRKHRPDRIHACRTERVFRVGPNIGDVHRPSLERCTRGTAMPSERDRIARRELHEFRRCTVGSRHAQDIAIQPVDERLVRGAQPDGALGHHLEYRLQVEGGAADHRQQPRSLRPSAPAPRPGAARGRGLSRRRPSAICRATAGLVATLAFAGFARCSIGPPRHSVESSRCGDGRQATRKCPVKATGWPVAGTIATARCGDCR